MSYVIRCWVWGVPEGDEHKPDRCQQRLPGWISVYMDERRTHCQNIRGAVRFTTENEALAAMWELPYWWESDEDGPWYWVEEVP